MNLRKMMVVGLGLMVATAAFGSPQGNDSVKAEAPKLKAQTLCPVMKKPIDSAAYTDIQGQRVYHCCRGCEKELRAHPDKYFEEAEKQGIVFQNIQTVCPVTGDPIDKRFETYYKGRHIYFSSADCVAKFDASPAVYLKKLDTKVKPATESSTGHSTHSH